MFIHVRGVSSSTAAPESVTLNGNSDGITSSSFLNRSGAFSNGCGVSVSSYVSSIYNFCTNASHYAGEAGIPTLGMGPSNESQAHVVDEYIELSQLDGVYGCYKSIMKALLK